MTSKGVKASEKSGPSKQMGAVGQDPFERPEGCDQACPQLQTVRPSL